jgi:hypothetical protein
VGRPLWREDGSGFCICRWPLLVQSFSGPSPLGLATVFYCLRFETFLFVASYDSQGHGGGIRPRLHTAKQSRAVAYCWQPASTVTLGIEPRWDPWQLQLTTYPAYNILARIAQKTPLLIVVVQSFPLEHVCLRSRYSVTALVYMLMSRSLSSNGSTCYNKYFTGVKLPAIECHAKVISNFPPYTGGAGFKSWSGAWSALTGVSWFFSVHPGEFQDYRSTSKQSTAAFIYILSNSLFTNYLSRHSELHKLNC